MKNKFLYLLFFPALLFIGVGYAHTPADHSPYFCAGGWGEDYSYYNLFAQENIEEPQYQAFLLTYENIFYTPDQPDPTLKNENIEEWQQYLGTTYDQAQYLVFGSKREDLRALAQGKPTADSKLGFADKGFVSKHKQALLYLAYAKYLAPYMAVKGDQRYYWGDKPRHTVDELDYDKVIGVLEKSWQAETDKELKLRYGYQLVRFAHYNRNYREAVAYFNTHVESLDHKPIMYYYALDQKGGAERGLGNFMQANDDFFRFFTHTRNRKEEAYTSMRVTRDLDFEKLLSEAKTPNEKNDLYLLLGYRDFNNPLSALHQIIKNDPNAPQAKVLMARAVNQLERNFFPVYYSCPYKDPDCMEKITEHHLPLSLDRSAVPFLELTLETALQQVRDDNVREKEFWQLTTAWLYFIRGDYETAQDYLKQFSSESAGLSAQKDRLDMLITITQQQEITKDFEDVLMTKYKDVLLVSPSDYDPYSGRSGSTRGFITDVLANRYLLQKDYAKAFLLQNHIDALEYNPDMEILDAIVELHNKKGKNDWEKMLAENIPTVTYDYQVRKYQQNPEFDFESYVANMKGNIYLWNGEPKKASAAFENVRKISASLLNFEGITSEIFGFNRIECFECPEAGVIQTDYLDEFPFVKSSMNKKELSDAIIRLQKTGEGNGEKAAKANYLLGNFYFNTSLIGYYRQMLTFSSGNGKNSKFHNYFYWGSHFIPTPPHHILYFKDYTWKPWYQDNFHRPLDFLDKALDQTREDELKARILFAASKCEQGIFYSIQDDEELNNVENLDYRERKNQLLAIKTSRYRKYFKALKALDHTSFYKEVKSNCKYFDYYSTYY
ncbi:hypothetical protein SAMN02927921_00676 [Sinomicrobium oceani]|uniref:Tetratricopeptide repeat-containing protein n=1 Tax=Sinomicrobium oceani TaxID=1150368 RepID=A0A1K1MNF8_9FLAO|nr:hypothetical protein [Sinomicrobium oceani]SFW24688.1 hypothetical protein SAMN02927921_00676 [Sinomicrobium oceani]